MHSAPRPRVMQPTCAWVRSDLQRLEKSGKGVALLKAARLQSDLDFLEKENQVLFSDVKNKASAASQQHS